MRLFLLLVLVAAGAACAIRADSRADMVAAITPHSACIAPPAQYTGRFRHAGSRFKASFGQPRHRGFDLIALDTDPTQTLGGKLAYSAADSDIVGEDVTVYACVENNWKMIGQEPTDKHGRFSLTLRGDDRLPAGMRDLFAISGDGVGFRFLAYVAKPGESVIVTDLDGTITSGEGAVLNSVLFHEDIGHRAGAPQALAASGHTVVYLSSRGDQLTNMTREWLREHGFPAGPIRLSRAGVTTPGPKTIAFKTAALKAIGVPIHAAIGNRATDVAAYANAGVSADHIFVKLPGFDDELADALAARRAIGFHTYDTLAPKLR